MKVLFEKKGPVAYVTINRPERLNACDGETYRRLTEVWREFRDDPVLRVGILTGAGDRAFCVGTDVKAHDLGGTHAEYVVVPAAAICPKPNNLSKMYYTIPTSASRATFLLHTSLLSGHRGAAPSVLG